MAIQALTPFPIPTIPPSAAGAPSFNTGYTLDAASEKVALILHAPKTGNIRKVGFRTSTVTTGETVDVRIESVDATTGDPSGTLLAANTNIAHVIADTDDNVWLTTANLTADAAVTKGDLIAIVIAAPGSGSFAFSIGEFADGAASSGPVFPYIDHFTTAWAKSTGGGGYSFALEYSDGSYEVIPGCWPLSNVQSDTFNNTSTPDERALKFRLPFPARVTGFWAWLDLDGDCDIVLYDSDGTTPLLTKSLDKDVRVGTGGRSMTGFFSSTASLLANTYYRLAVKPTSATNLISYRLQVAAAAVMDGLDGGQDFHGSTRVDAGSWTDTTTDRPTVGLLIDAFDDGVSAGGGVGPAIMKAGHPGFVPIF